jgi:hypothetical protein
METLHNLPQQLSLPLISGVPDGPARTLAMPTAQAEAGLPESEAGYSTLSWRFLQRYDLRGLSWKMCRASSQQKTEPLLRQLSAASKRSGIWGDGHRLTLSMRVCLTTATEYSLSDLLETTVPITSFLTGANCQGILRREQNAEREMKLDTAFKAALEDTIRLWSNAAEASGILLQQAFAPRYVPKLASIKAVIQTGPYFVARNLTWNECENLMGFPAGWTVVEAASSATRSAQQSSNGSGEE